MSSARRGGGAGIGSKPTLPGAEHWVADGAALAAPAKADLCTGRLTIDVTPALRAHIKLAAFARGLTVAEMLRALLEQRFPEAPATAGQGNGS